MSAEYDSALEDIRSAIDALSASAHADSESVVSAVRDAPQVQQVDVSDTLDGMANLLGYTDLLLLVLVVVLVVFAGLFVGFIVTDRLR